MSGSKRVILASDAPRALLFYGDVLQAEFTKEIEIASFCGYAPLYNLMTLTALDQELLREGENQARRKLMQLVPILSKASFIGIPQAEDLAFVSKLIDEIAVGQGVAFADMVGLAMAVRLDAPILTKDEATASFISRMFPRVPIPPFVHTLGKTVEEARQM